MSKELLICFSLLFVIVFYMSATSWACPLCHTSTADELRSRLNVTFLDKSIWMGILLPFVVIVGVIQIMNNRFVNRDADNIRKLGEDR